MSKTYLEVGLSCVHIGRKQILKDIYFDTGAGITGILGRNGAGKTTLLKALAGIQAKAVGTIRCAGTDVVTIPAAERAKIISYVPQEWNTSMRVKAVEFVLLGRAAHLGMFEMPSEADREIAYSAMKKLGIEKLADRYYDTLSGGEKKLCYLARAMTQGSEITLLDEPAAGLDFGRQYGFFDVLNTGLFPCALVSMHDPNLAYRYCDRVIILDKGTVLDVIDMKSDKNCDEKYICALRTMYGEHTEYAYSGKSKTVIWRDDAEC